MKPDSTNEHSESNHHESKIIYTYDNTESPMQRIMDSFSLPYQKIRNSLSDTNQESIKKTMPSYSISESPRYNENDSSPSSQTESPFWRIIESFTIHDSRSSSTNTESSLPSTELQVNDTETSSLSTESTETSTSQPSTETPIMIELSAQNVERLPVKSASSLLGSASSSLGSGSVPSLAEGNSPSLVLEERPLERPTNSKMFAYPVRHEMANTKFQFFLYDVENRLIRRWISLQQIQVSSILDISGN